MPSFYHNLSCFAKARLSRQLALWIAASIIVIEIIILVPSYYRRKNELLQQVEGFSQIVVDSLVESKNQGMLVPEILDKLEIVTQSSSVLGLVIYNQQGEMIGGLGEAIEIPYSELAAIQEAPNLRMRRYFGDRYEIALSISPQGRDYIIVTRHDLIPIKTELKAFTLRIIGLVAIISIFVTGVMMIVLGFVVISPILQLRDDLNKVGDALKTDQSQVNFSSLQLRRKDEFGDVLAAFNIMYERIYKEMKQRQETEKYLRLEQEESEKLLLNILPKSIAEKLKHGEKNIANEFPEATILFADIVGFTELSVKICAEDLVNLLNEIFSCFDGLSEKHHLEKIKTIGDAYMVVGGLPMLQPNHAECVAEMALDMLAEITKFNQKLGINCNIRIGMNTGSVVAGVIGTKKFTYDLWGDTVNTASRMESHGIPGKIQVTEATYLRLKDQYEFVHRGLIPVKGKGEMNAYLLIGRKQIS